MILMMASIIRPAGKAPVKSMSGRPGFVVERTLAGPTRGLPDGGGPLDDGRTGNRAPANGYGPAGRGGATQRYSTSGRPAPR
jgi:hypothetical protein